MLRSEIYIPQNEILGTPLVHACNVFDALFHPRL